MELKSTWMFFEPVETEHAVKQSSSKKDGEKLSVHYKIDLEYLKFYYKQAVLSTVREKYVDIPTPSSEISLGL